MFKHFGDNLKTWGKDVWEEYLKGPYKHKDPIQMVVGPIQAALSTLLEASDYAYAGIVDNRLEAPRKKIGRISRDTRQFFDNILHFHPLKAVGDVFRLAFADIPLDLIDAVGDFRKGGFHMRQTRSAIDAALHTPAPREPLVELAMPMVVAKPSEDLQARRRCSSVVES